MIYQIGDAVRLKNGWPLIVDVRDGDEPDTAENRGFYSRSNIEEMGGGGAPLWPYDEGAVQTVLGNVITDGWAVLNRVP